MLSRAATRLRACYHGGLITRSVIATVTLLAAAGSCGAADAARDQTRRQIKSTLFIPEYLPPLAPEAYGQFSPAPGVVAERISYATDYGLRIPAIVYRPAQAPAGKMPGLIVVNGHAGDKYSWYAFYTGMLYAQAGAVVVTYDPIGEGERNVQRKSATGQHDEQVEPPEMGRRMGGLMVTDIMQAVSYLAKRPDVDPKRLAVLSYSMGSFISGIACAVERRLHACVLTGGGNLDGPGGYWDSSSHKMCQATPYQSLLFPGDRGAVLYDLHAARGPDLILNGTADQIVAKAGPPFFDDLRKRVLALGADPHNVFDYDYVPAGGHRPYFVTLVAARWLEKHLDFANWTPGSIARMPETHIGDWAARNKISIPAAFSSELREGGTLAAGKDIPAIARKLLNALPPERWERDKEKYVYESWLKEARARCGTKSRSY